MIVSSSRTRFVKSGNYQTLAIRDAKQRRQRDRRDRFDLGCAVLPAREHISLVVNDDAGCKIRIGSERLQNPLTGQRVELPDRRRGIGGDHIRGQRCLFEKVRNGIGAVVGGENNKA